MRTVFDLLRLILAFAVIVIAVGAAVFVAFASEADPPIIVATAIVGVVGVIGSLPVIFDRIAFKKEQRSDNQPIERSEQRYLEGRLRWLEEEHKLFVKLGGSTQIHPEFTTQEQSLDDINEAVKMHKGRFVLIGDPGAGKSTALRDIERRSITGYRTDRIHHKLPFWINLGSSSNPEDVDDLLRYWWDQHALPDTPEQYLRRHNLFLLFDGLNEMPLDSRERRARVIQEWIARHKDAPAAPVIVTCRVRDYEDDAALKLALPVVRVKPLDWSRTEEFIHRCATADAEDGRPWDASQLIERIKTSEGLRRLAENPYYLVLIDQGFPARGYTAGGAR